MVIDHHAALAQMGADIDYIRRRIDNGLTERMEALNTRLDGIDKDSWATNLLSGSLKKFIGLVIGVVLLNSLASNAIWATLKKYHFEEVPGQQKVSAEQSVTTGYHTHQSGNVTIYHSGEPEKPAWIYNNTRQTWEKAPFLRTEDQVERSIKP